MRHDGSASMHFLVLAKTTEGTRQPGLSAKFPSDNETKILMMMMMISFSHSSPVTITNIASASRAAGVPPPPFLAGNSRICVIFMSTREVSVTHWLVVVVIQVNSECPFVVALLPTGLPWRDFERFV